MDGGYINDFTRNLQANKPTSYVATTATSKTAGSTDWCF